MEIHDQDLMDLIFWARRYCDRRATYAPSSFNRIYKKIMSKYGLPNDEALKLRSIENDQKDETLMKNGSYWPYAQDGMFDEKTGSYDAT